MSGAQAVLLPLRCPVAGGLVGNGVGSSVAGDGWIGQKLGPCTGLRKPSFCACPRFGRPSSGHQARAPGPRLRFASGGAAPRALGLSEEQTSNWAEGQLPQLSPVTPDNCRSDVLPSGVLIVPLESELPVGDSQQSIEKTGPLWPPGAWLAGVLQKVGPVLAAACLALAWLLTKPSPAFARSRLARPPPISASRDVTGGAKGGARADAISSHGVAQSPGSTVPSLLDQLPLQAAHTSCSTDSSQATVDDVSTSASGLRSTSRMASLSQAISSAHLPNPLANLNPHWLRFPVSESAQDSQPSISDAPEPPHSTTSTYAPPDTSSPYDQQASGSGRPTPVQRGGNPDSFFKDTLPPSRGTGVPSSSGGSSNPTNSDDKKPKGVQQKEKLDVYYLPEQIPRPAAGQWVSDQGEFLKPDWITPRINQILTKLKKDTGTEIYVVAISALGKHAGVPEMVAIELCEQWKVGGRDENGLLFLYINKGGSSWRNTEEGAVEMDVPYKRQLAVKVLPGLEKALKRWGEQKKKPADEAIAELREIVLVKTSLEGATVGQVILEGLVSIAEKVWALQGVRVPADLRKDPRQVQRWGDVQAIGLALAIAAVWSVANRGNRVSARLAEVYTSLAGGFDRVTRRPGPACGSCGEYSVLKGKAKPEEITDPGAKAEMEMGAVDYYKYVCDNLDCKGSPEEKTAMIGWVVPFRGVKTCPGCKYRTVKQTSERLQPAGLVRDGEVKRKVECKNCGLKGERQMRSPSLLSSLRVWEGQPAEVGDPNREDVKGSNQSSTSIQPAEP